MAKKTYNVILVKTKYYEGIATVEAESEEEARELASEAHVFAWDATDEEIEVAESDDAVTEND